VSVDGAEVGSEVTMTTVVLSKDGADVTDGYV